MTIQASTLPNLEIGVETPWPMKREGKQVYAKLIDFGEFPGPYGSGGKTHNVPDIEWCQISWDHSYVASSTDSRRQSLALIYTPILGGGPMPWRFLADHNSIQVQMTSNKDYREWDTIILCLLYTKTSEGAESGSLIKPGPDGLLLTSRKGELVWEEAAAGSGCECEIAAPNKSGLVPEGGLPGQIYQVNPEGNAYEWRQGRIVLDSDLILYVRVDGDDGNDGLADSPERAKATLHGALKEITNYDLRNNVVRIYMGPGEYSPATINRVYSLNVIHVYGADNYETVFQPGFGVYNGLFHFHSTQFNTNNGGFFAYNKKALVTLISPRFNGLSSSAFAAHAMYGGHMNITGDIEFRGTFAAVLDAYFQGFLHVNGKIKASGTLTHQFARSYDLGLMVFMPEVTISGQMSGGVKYWVGPNAVMQTHNKGLNFLPGTGAGSVSSGGVYY